MKSLYIISRKLTCKEFLDQSQLLPSLEKIYRNIGVFSPFEDEACIKKVQEFFTQGKQKDFLKDILSQYDLLCQKHDFILIFGLKDELLDFHLPFYFNSEMAKTLNSPIINMIENSQDLAKNDFYLNFAKQRAIHSHAQYFASLIPKNLLELQKDTDEIFTYPLKNDEAFLTKVQNFHANITTPEAFEYELLKRAKMHKKTIVLPESDDQRVLLASHELLKEDVANIILLGDELKIEQSSKALNIDLSKAKIINPQNSELKEEFSQKFYELRKNKGMNLEKAKETMQDPNYFATMMIYSNLADGMVSGAIGTTANTIRPALQIIKTKPETPLVSSVFFMCTGIKAYCFADCAINPKPNEEELATIAISTAKSAKNFGFDTKLAFISYASGDSASGEEVQKIKNALNIAKDKAPHILMDGPMQYDASIDKQVASKKMPNSKVAGEANVLIFPDLNTANTTYKAVQRSSHGLAIGPILQGLKKPINDLSRGCMVADIINTVAITAIQAQQ